MLAIGCILAAVGLGVTGQAQPSPAGSVDAFLERIAAYGYAGVVAVADDGREAYEGAFGLADHERGLPVEPETRFDIGSLTKPFVATVILRLVEDGRLSLADSLSRYFEDAPSEKANITIHQLLTHSSGFVRTSAALGVEAQTPRDAFVAAVLGSELLHPPGERFEYSDTGYDLLAAIAEIESGRQFGALLDSLVLKPAGTSRTGYADEPRLGAVAPSYAGALGTPWLEDREGPSAPTWYNRGSGGLASTAGDLLRFERALRQGRILSKGSLEQMWAAQVAIDERRAYGYGWFLADSPHGRVIYHGGDIAGYKAHLARYPGRGITFAALDNVYGWERITDRDAIAVWFGEDLEAPPEPQPLESTNLGAVEGTYRTPQGSPLVVWTEAGRLVVEASGQQIVDHLFAGETAERTVDAEEIIAALQRSDTAFVAARMRERDRARGLQRNFIGYWTLLSRRDGPVTDFQVLGSVPAQDGTVVSIIELHHSGKEGARRDVFRLVWRGDRLVSAGGDAGLRRPTALFEPVAATSAARYAVGSQATTTLRFEEDRVHISAGDATLLAVRDTATAIEPPPRSIVRTLLPVILRKGPDAGLAALDQLREPGGQAYDTSELALNDLGYALLHAGATDAAIAVFERNVAEHPESSNAHDSLGEAYLAVDRVEEARESYARSLALDPDNEHAREVLGDSASNP